MTYYLAITKGHMNLEDFNKLIINSLWKHGLTSFFLIANKKRIFLEFSPIAFLDYSKEFVVQTGDSECS